MTGLTKARRIACACAISAASVAAIAAPSSASAACGSGTDIHGSGSSLQANAQVKYWGENFNKICTSEGKTNEQTSYTSTSSGKGLAAWRSGSAGKIAEFYKGFGPDVTTGENAFIGTDLAPNAGQESEILAGAAASVLTFPTLQAAVALPIHLPKACTEATTGKGKTIKHRLAVQSKTIEEIFRGEIKTWKEFIEKEDTVGKNFDKLVGAGCEETAPISLVVRKEGSGTTNILKKYLDQLVPKGEKIKFGNGERTWAESAERNENEEWPEEAHLIKEEKGSGVTSGVAATEGSIGYANVNEVRENTHFVPPPTGTGGASTPTFWPEVQLNGTKAGGKYIDPATNGEVDAAESANCNAVDYISATGEKYPPASVESLWTGTTASIKETKAYPICGFTYDLAVTKYSLVPGVTEPTSAAEVETVKNYYTYILSASGQKTDLAKTDFAGLPEGTKGKNDVLAIAQKGLEKIGF